jgi:hypothetical protein
LSPNTAFFRRFVAKFRPKQALFHIQKLKPQNTLELAQFKRRIAYTLADDLEETAFVASPEDNILAKLERYRLGGEVSDRQWQDILNVIKIQGDRLDQAYLEKWADQLEVGDLLQRALDEST